MITNFGSDIGGSNDSMGGMSSNEEKEDFAEPRFSASISPPRQGEFDLPENDKSND